MAQDKKLKAIFGTDWHRLDEEEKANAGNLLTMRETTPNSSFTDENIRHFATNPQGRLVEEDKENARLAAEAAAQAERDRLVAERLVEQESPNLATAK